MHNVGFRDWALNIALMNAYNGRKAEEFMIYSLTWKSYWEKIVRKVSKLMKLLKILECHEEIEGEIE